MPETTERTGGRIRIGEQQPAILEEKTEKCHTTSSTKKHNQMNINNSISELEQNQ